MARRLGLLVLQLLMTTGLAFAQNAAPAPTLEEKVAKLEGAVAAAQTSGDNAWLLTSSALVLMMTGPGLFLFYGGLVRRKNVLSVIMQCVFLMAMVSLLWALYGYSLAFGDGSPFIGGTSYLFLDGVGAAPNPTYAATIPHGTFMVFQMMFAIITPALICGAFAERMKFSAMALFMALWLTIVYLPMAHMVWGNNGYLNAYLGGVVKCFDFAGGTVVHITSGVSALVCALYMGKRVGYPTEPMRPHSLVLSSIGAGMLWVGWFGFNAGSALGAGGLATAAFVATHLGAAAATLGWTLAEWMKHGRPSLLGAISGCVAGLVAITPASGFVKPMPAIIIGFLAGVICFVMVVVAKNKFGYDDSLDAFGVHGVGGTLGALLTGVFATNQINDALKDAAGKPAALGLVDGNGGQIFNQLTGVAIAWVLAIVGTIVILKIVDVVIGVRVSKEQEIEGLDLTQHGEEGYSFES